VHTIEVHVGQPRLDVVATGEHLVEADRIEPEVLGVLAGDGVQPDRRDDLPLEAPRLRPAVELDDLGTGFLVLRREPVDPHPLVFDDMVVDRDELDIVGEHAKYRTLNPWREPGA